MTIAWVFPGQGSQKLGMADDVFALPDSTKRFQLASEILQRDLLEITRGNSHNDDQLYELNDTRNTQPALFVIESLLVDDFKKQGRKANFVAGHSLGEFVALYSAEVLDLEASLNLLKIRSELMAAAGGGAMTAIIGFDREELESLIDINQEVVIANDNSAEQVVLSGTVDGIKNVVTKIKCKRIIPLNVSGAFHSPYMDEASKEFCFKLDKVDFNDAIFPVLSNSDPNPTIDGGLLKEKLKQQMTSGVRWRETMQIFEQKEITTLVEIGPGKVLTGLAKRSMKGISLNQISSATDLGY